jgi:hypothetical protein
MIKNTKSFVKGVFMSIVFVVILALLFIPIYNGGNAFRAADKLFNTISKGSTYYIPMLKQNVEQHKDGAFDGIIKVEKQLDDVRKVLKAAGADVTADGGNLKIKVGLGMLYDAALRDSDDMFHNRGKSVRDRYGLPEKQVLFAWWNAFKGLEKALSAEKRFSEAAYIGEVLSRGVAVGYNYYKVTPKRASDRWLILTSALIFYVIYTLWWGFAVYFLFEGLGFQLTAGHKKES